MEEPVASKGTIDKEEKELNILEFMKENNLTLSNDEIFLELWTSLYNKKDILITPNLLLFLSNGNEKNTVQILDHDFKYLKKCFLRFLRENNIEFEQINYQDSKCKNYDYILNDIKNIDSRTLHLKKWISLTIDNFKEVAMIKSEYIRKYYLKIENYTNEFIK